MIANDPQNLGTTDLFKCFYNGFDEEFIIWFAFHDDNNDYENPIKFHFDTWGEDEHGVNSLKEVIAPRILPANFTSGRGQHSFEFYYPSIAARQLGFGQVSTQFYFTDKIQTRDAIKSGLAFNRLKSLESDAGIAELANWQITPFTTTPFV